MVSRRTIALLLGSALVIGYVQYDTVSGPFKPTLTVENNDTTAYQLSAYTVESREQAMYLNFEVTTRDGEHRLKTLSQLIWPDGDRNVTLADDGVPTQQITVAPGETVTTTIDGWTRGDVTVYLGEKVADNGTHVYTRIRTCPRTGQEHSLTFEEAGTSGSATCA
ncbi:hypothetical protein ACNO8S_19735 (plasmid) [Haloarcula sp. KBTZ06]|uniref:Uncharacterized protein n=1 Tax=Haloarcula hispanica TaxID=51589 RepID=A0A482TK99_HALHI|nr:hypothetical protein [Haloarcula hispanica]KAA9400974.1 hypothetical protein Har1131_20295 [Haloarcula sp. CBA1131]KZX49944.1 hypothetical protein AV929_12585 [Haloarcula sp. K1]MCJ0618183.1 hypothetical protein [Haloarcula hispanica]RYJ15688.1 hypothetical protein ELS20_01195 [Haloarcula hispanica]